MIDDPDRMAVRARPRGSPIFRQHWGTLLFLHWRVPAERVRALVPPALELDLWEGGAWVGVTPFTIWGARPQLAPPVPFASSFHELNVRTYVVHGRTPGVWFFSLDAASALAVMGARLLYHLPYFRAAMSLERRGDTVVYRSRRTHAGAPPAELACVWHVGAPRPAAAPGTLEFFLVERYALFALHRRRPHVARVHHAPWPLQDASVSELRSTMVEAAGMPAPAGPPLVHYAEHVAVDIWPLTRSHP